MGIVESGTTVILYNSTNHIIMVVTFGNNIEGAFTGGQSVEAIYTGSTKVWPEGSGPDPGEYYIKWWPKDAYGVFTADSRQYYLMDWEGYYNGPMITTGVTDEEGFKEISTITAIETNYLEIANATFFRCSNLRYASMSQAESIGTMYVAEYPRVVGPFCNCTHLNSVYLPKCKYVGYATFNNCYSLTDIELPECIGIEGYAFSTCTNLISISLPKCRYINGYDTFLRCKLTDVILPECSWIGPRVFEGCDTLRTLTIGYSGVCDANIPEAGLGLYGHSSVSIYVPLSLLSSYKSTYPGRSSQFYPIPYSN